MIVVLKHNPNRDQLESLIAWLQEKGIIIHTSIGEAHTAVQLSPGPVEGEPEQAQRFLEPP